MLLNSERIIESKHINPTDYLERRGFKVQRDGTRHLSVRSGPDEIYRISKKPDGHWVACDKGGRGIGDNIALVRDLEPGLQFLEAVERLYNGPVVQREPLHPPPRARPARLPQTPDNRHAGRIYLHQRGISGETLDQAEHCGFLRYTGGGVLFVGRDGQGNLRNVTKRLIAPAEGEKPKRDLAGSDKSYPPILQGNPSVVWIVEGGVDALAAHDLAKRRGKLAPTVIVSGGAAVRVFLENPTVQALLLKAESVVVVRDNETTSKKQAETDSAHDLQTAHIIELRGRCADWRPPAGVKDIADLNRLEVTGCSSPS